MLIKTHIGSSIMLSNNFTHFVKFLKRNRFNMFDVLYRREFIRFFALQKITEPNEHNISYRRQKRDSYFA